MAKKTKTQEEISENSTLQKLTLKKRAMIQALKETRGVVSMACDKAGITRTTHYDWQKIDPNYKQAVDEITEFALDIAESVLFNKIEMGSTPELLFFLKCKGKARGYVEKEVVNTTESLQYEVVNVNG